MQQERILEECLCLIIGPCSELFGQGIGGLESSQKIKFCTTFFFLTNQQNT